MTDALKRVLRSFGDRFGNGLYGDPPTSARSSRGPEPASRTQQRSGEPASQPPLRRQAVQRAAEPQQEDDPNAQNLRYDPQRCIGRLQPPRSTLRRLTERGPRRRALGQVPAARSDALRSTEQLADQQSDQAENRSTLFEAGKALEPVVVRAMQRAGWQVTPERSGTARRRPGPDPQSGSLLAGLYA